MVDRSTRMLLRMAAPFVSPHRELFWVFTPLSARLDLVNIYGERTVPRCVNLRKHMTYSDLRKNSSPLDACYFNARLGLGGLSYLLRIDGYGGGRGSLNYVSF